MKQIDLFIEKLDKTYKIRDVLPQKYQDEMNRLKANPVFRGITKKEKTIKDLVQKTKEEFEKANPDQKYDKGLFETPPELELTEDEIVISQKLRNITLRGLVIEPRMDEKFLESDECDSVEVELLSQELLDKIFGPESRYDLLKKKDAESSTSKIPKPS